MRLIDADTLKEHKVYSEERHENIVPVANIDWMPTIDAVPMVHGRWIHLDPEESTISGKCSCCRWEAHYYEDDVTDMPYCPNCGAKMDLEEQDAAD